MANTNHVIVNGETILDLRADTVTPEALQKGYTAHDKSGTKITGTLEASSVSVQPSKSVTITSNGTVSVTPDVPYDALKKVDVTVNVASSGGGGETTSLNVSMVEGTVKAQLFCLWQTSDGWMGTTNFDTTESFTIPNVIVGGYVIFTRNPAASSYFSTSDTIGVENIGVGAMDAKWDIPEAALVIKVTAPSPRFFLNLSY